MAVHHVVRRALALDEGQQVRLELVEVRGDRLLLDRRRRARRRCCIDARVRAERLRLRLRPADVRRVKTSTA